jgi:very-short-patch-repair endonuclease
MNPSLTWSGETVFYQGRPLTVSQEQVQLFFTAAGCNAEVTHYRLLTPYTVHKGADMTCFFCQGNYRFETEAAVGRALKRAGLDTVTTWQCRPPGAGSVVDFYVYTAGLIIQVDGTAHTEGVRPDRLPRQLLQHDISRCVAAWQGGLKLMRIHYDDMEDWLLPWVLQWVVAKCTYTPGPLILLSPGYQGMGFQHPARRVYVGYAQYLRECIGCSVPVRAGWSGWCVLQ